MKLLLKHKGIWLTYIILIGVFIYSVFSFSSTCEIGEEPFIGCDEVVFTSNLSDTDISVIHTPENSSPLAKVRLYEKFKYKNNADFKNKQEYSLTAFDYYIYTYKNLEINFNNVTYDLIDTGFNHEIYTNDSALFFVCNGTFAMLIFFAFIMFMHDDYYEYEDIKDLTSTEKLNLKLWEFGKALLMFIISWIASINSIILYYINDYYGFSQGLFGIILSFCLIIIFSLHILCDDEFT